MIKDFIYNFVKITCYTAGYIHGFAIGTIRKIIRNVNR